VDAALHQCICCPRSPRGRDHGAGIESRCVDRSAGAGVLHAVGEPAIAGVAHTSYWVQLTAGTKLHMHAPPADRIAPEGRCHSLQKPKTVELFD